jgi:hypothetical protein
MNGRIRVSDSFFLDEFIHPSIYRERGSRSISLIDHRVILAAQFIREKTGRPIVINNWAVGGKYQDSGLRTFDSTVGAKWSQHKYGRAIDQKSELGPSKLLQIVMENEQYLIDHQIITTVENIQSTPTWLHTDCRYTGMNKILIVNP